MMFFPSISDPLETIDIELQDNNKKQKQIIKNEISEYIDNEDFTLNKTRSGIPNIENNYLEKNQRKDELENQNKQTDVEKEENVIRKRKGEEINISNFEKKYSEFSEPSNILSVSTKLQENEKKNKNKKRKKNSEDEI